MSVIENLNGQNRPRTALVWSTKCKLQLSVARIPPWCSLLGMNAVEDGLSVRLGHLAFSHATAGGGAGEDGQDAESVLRSDEENVEGHTNGNTSPPAQTEATKKKKKKNKAKKAAQATEAEIEAGRIKISRNKHMRFISSYHGPWLQLPHEILDSLFELNSDSKALAAASDRASRLDSTHSALCRACAGMDARDVGHSHAMATFDDIAAEAGEKLPMPIDSAVFRGCTEVRGLIDVASDLAVRAASGLSAAALGAIATSTANSGGSIAAALGIENTINGRSAAMSATRQHRLRAMAVAKLAQAYTIDEVAASVAVMQGATAIDDIAEKVLKLEPSNTDAMLVHFFHEKIPSAPSIARSWAQKQPSIVLNMLMEHFPERLNYFRSSGIWQTFKQDYQGAIRTYDQGIANAQALRQAKKRHRRPAEKASKGAKKRKGKGSSRTTQDTQESLRQDGPDSSEGKGHSNSLYSRSPESMPACDEAADVGKEPGDDLERQLYFFRGMAKFQLASSLIEKQVLLIEGIPKPPGGLVNEGGELTLDNIGIKVKPDSATFPQGSVLGSCTAAKAGRYHELLASPSTREPVIEAFKNAMEDFKHFLSYFAVWEAPANSSSYRQSDHERQHLANQHLIRTNGEKAVPFRGRRLVHHRALNGRTRYTDPRLTQELAPQSALLTSYHPLIIEAHFSVLLILLLIGDIKELLKQHYRCARLMEYIEGYPVFVPARSTNQSEYVELMELLSASWAKSRESAGISAPSHKDSVESIAAQGDLASLHHLVAYFSEDHNARLNAAAAKAEEEALEMARAAADRKGTAARSLLDKKLLEEAKVRDAALANEAKQITNGDDPDKPYNTARSEVALAWLHVAILPQLEEGDISKRNHAHGNANGLGKAGGPSTSTSTSDSFPELFRPGSSASTTTFPATASSRATSPSSAPSVTSSKGKGKARALDDAPGFDRVNGGSNSSKGKGRAL